MKCSEAEWLRPWKACWKIARNGSGYELMGTQASLPASWLYPPITTRQHYRITCMPHGNGNDWKWPVQDQTTVYSSHKCDLKLDDPVFMDVSYVFFNDRILINNTYYYRAGGMFGSRRRNVYIGSHSVSLLYPDDRCYMSRRRISNYLMIPANRFIDKCPVFPILSVTFYHFVNESHISIYTDRVCLLTSLSG